MGVTSGIVLFAVIWFLVLFVVLPLRLTTQGEAGSVVPGTPESAPEGLMMRAKLRLTTWIAALLWFVLAAVILSGAIEVRDFDWLGRLPPVPTDAAPGG
jgi:predicted secreted protein